MNMPGIGNRESGKAPSPPQAGERAGVRGRTGALVCICALFASLLAGCSVLGSGPQGGPATIYAPNVRIPTDPAWPAVDWSLAIAQPSAARVIDGTRISVRPTPDELQVYKGAVWAQPATGLLEDALLRTLEDSGRIASVARLGAGARSDYRLLLDLRRFEADYAGQSVPSATIEVNAKLMRVRDQHIVAARTFLQAQPAAAVEVPQVAAAFEQALTAITRDLAGWTLQSGQADASVRR